MKNSFTLTITQEEGKTKAALEYDPPLTKGYFTDPRAYYAKIALDALNEEITRQNRIQELAGIISEGESTILATGSYHQAHCSAGCCAGRPMRWGE